MLYKKFYRKFDDKEIIGIIAEWMVNNKKSNRSGKSTVLEAVKYCLFGLSRAKKEVNLIHKGEEIMWVEIGLLDDNGELHIVKRGRDIKNHGILETSWNEKKGEAQKEIDDLIGCTKEDFELTNFFTQSQVNKFMELGGPDKTVHLMKWFKKTHWMKLAKRIGFDLGEKEKELIKQRTKKDTLLEDLGDRKTIKKKIAKIETNIDSRNTSLEELRAKKKKLEKKVKSKEEVVELEDQLNQFNEDMNELQDNINDGNSVEEDLRKECKKLVKLQSKKVGKYSSNKLDRTTSKLFNLKYEKRTIREKLSVMRTSFCGTCPVLNEECDRIKKDPKLIKKYEKEIKVIDSKRQELEDENSKIREAKEHLESISSQEKLVSELDGNRVDTKALKKKLKGLKAKYESLEDTINSSSSSDVEDKILLINGKIKKKKLGLDELNQKLGQYQSNLVRIKKAKSKASDIGKVIEGLEEEVEDLKYLAFMFGKNGIPSQEIENAFQDIEEEINFILDKMNTNMEVSFQGDKETGSWEEDCVGCGARFKKGSRKKECIECGADRKKKRKTETHLTVLENGYESDFDMESGGGKFFVSFAVRIALTMLKLRQTGSNFRVLFLDEVDSSLDDDAREQLMKLITTVLMKNFGFQQIFWVSHNKNIQASVPHTLKVLRYKTYAKTKWV